MLYISENVPFPDKQSDEYIKAIADEIDKLVEAAYGHTVILFTSYSLLSKVYELVRYKIKYPVLKMEKARKTSLKLLKIVGTVFFLLLVHFGKALIVQEIYFLR